MCPLNTLNLNLNFSCKEKAELFFRACSLSHAALLDHVPAELFLPSNWQYTPHHTSTADTISPPAVPELLLRVSKEYIIFVFAKRALLVKYHAEVQTPPFAVLLLQWACSVCCKLCYNPPMPFSTTGLCRSELC